MGFYVIATSSGSNGLARNGWAYEVPEHGPISARTNLEIEKFVRGNHPLHPVSGPELELLMGVRGFAEFVPLPANPPGTQWGPLTGPGRPTGRVIYPGSGSLPTFPRVDIGSAVDHVELAELMAPPVTAALAVRVAVLPDLDIERIRDASVEANELCKGTITGNTVRFTRVAQPV